jgi:hypothetical protein
MNGLVLNRPRRKGEFSFDGPISITPGGEIVPRTRAMRFCGPCAAGSHGVRHSEVGCLRVLGREPRDVVCDCEVAG